MRKVVSIVIIGFILLVAVSTAFADATVSVSKQTVKPGDTVKISGTTNADENVAIKIVDSAGNIVYFGGVKADSSGNYSDSYTVPTDMADGTLRVTAGSGSDTATVEISVAAPPTPTQKPTAKPTEQPSEQPAQKPAAKPTDQPTEQQGAPPTERPTGNAEEQTATSAPVEGLTPIESGQNQETGDITILIDTGDLPAGTVKLKLPDGTKIDIGNKETVEVIISADEIKADGTIEIVALDGENVPLLALSVQTNQESRSNGLSVLWWMLGGFVVLMIAIVLIAYLILQKRKVD